MNILIVLHKYGVKIDDPCCFPLGLMYISAVLKQNGHNVKVLNYNLHDYSLNEYLADTDAAMFSGFEEFKDRIEADAALCRIWGVKTILGGALATFEPDEMLKYVDTVVIGEGEAVVEDALHKKGKVFGVPSDVDTLPYPDYEGFGIDEYHAQHSIGYMGVLASRGCPYSCRFCAQTCSYRERNLSLVFDEIDYYRQRYGITHVVFNDNTLNVRKGRFMAICAGMKLRGLKWSAAVRADKMDDHMAAAFKASGGEYFVVGVESFEQKKLDMMNKRLKVSQLIDALDTIHRHGIGYHGNVLFGFPDETMDDIRDELSRVPPKYNVYPALVQPFVGTGFNGRGISVEETQYLDGIFKDYVRKAGMNHYPTLAA